MEKIFNGKKTAKLGTAKNPAVVNVKTKKRMKEVAKIFEKNGWKYTIGLEPDKPEDIAALERLLNLEGMGVRPTQLTIKQPAFQKFRPDHDLFQNLQNLHKC